MKRHATTTFGRCRAAPAVLLHADQSPNGWGVIESCVLHVPFALSFSTRYPPGGSGMSDTHLAAVYMAGQWRVDDRWQPRISHEHRGCCWEFATTTTIRAWYLEQLRPACAASKSHIYLLECSHDSRRRNGERYSCTDELRRNLSGTAIW